MGSHLDVFVNRRADQKCVKSSVSLGFFGVIQDAVYPKNECVDGRRWSSTVRLNLVVCVAAPGHEQPKTDMVQLAKVHLRQGVC